MDEQTTETPNQRSRKKPAKTKPESERAITVALPDSYSVAAEAIGAAEVGITASEARAIIRKAAIKHLATMPSVADLVSNELEARRAKLGQLKL